MAMSAGEMIVRLLLQSNSKEVLSQMTGDAQRADRALEGLIKTASGFTVQTKGGIIVTQDMNRALKEQEKQTSSNSKTVRQYLSEQRLQNRLARETTQAVTAIALAMSFLTDSQENASESSKAMASSLLRGVAIMNAAEFSMFALGKSAAMLSGTLGAIGTRMIALASPVGIALGIVTALGTMMSKANEEGKKSEKEGIGKFIDKLTSASGADLKFLHAAIDQMDTLKKQANDLILFTQQMDLGGGGGFAAADVSALGVRASIIENIKVAKEGRGDIVAEIEKEIDRQEILNEFNEKFRALVMESGNEIQKLQVQLEIVNEQLKAGVTVDASGKNLIEERVRITRELAVLLQTADEKQANRLAAAEHEYQMGRLNRADLIEKLDAELKLVDTAERRRELEAAILKLTNDEKQAVQEINDYWYEAASKAQAQFEEATRQLGENRTKVEMARIQDQTDLKIAQENERYRKEIDHLKDLEMKTQDVDETRYQARVAMLNHEANLRSIMMQKELDDLRVIGDTVEHIGTVLYQSFSGAGSTLLKQMVGVLRIAIRVAETVKLMELGKVSQGIGGLGIIGSVLGIFGLFDRGGYTGMGHRMQPAGIVHRGEVVFEKPIVDRHRDSLLNLRAALQTGYAGGGLAGGGSFDSGGIARAMAAAGGSDGSVSMEIRALRRDLREGSIRAHLPKEGVGLTIDYENLTARLKQVEREMSDWRRRKTF